MKKRRCEQSLEILSIILLIFLLIIVIIGSSLLYLFIQHNSTQPVPVALFNDNATGYLEVSYKQKPAHHTDSKMGLAG
jgi:hypothetical protein